MARTYQVLEAPEADEWKCQQKFAIPNPPSSPWVGWDELHVDPLAPIDPKTWVVGLETSADGSRRPILGLVRNLQQRFTVTDVRTGKEVTMGSANGLVYGAVVGMGRCLLDRKKRKLAAAAEMEKVAKKAKRNSKTGARSTDNSPTS